MERRVRGERDREEKDYLLPSRPHTEAGAKALAVLSPGLFSPSSSSGGVDPELQRRRCSETLQQGAWLTV